MHARIKFLSHAKPLQRHQNKPLVTINFQPKSKPIPFKTIGTPIYESAQHLFKTTKEKTKKKSRTTSNDKEKCGADWQHRHHICLSHLSHCLPSSHPAGPTRPERLSIFYLFPGHFYSICWKHLKTKERQYLTIVSRIWILRMMKRRLQA